MLVVEQTTVSARIPKKLGLSLEKASESEGAFRSELIRRALWYYVAQNPDGIREFGKAREQEGSSESRSGSGAPDAGVNRIYSSMEDT